MRKRTLLVMTKKDERPAAPPATKPAEVPHPDPPVQLLGLPPLQRLAAGAVTPVAGVYRAYHAEHRLPHSVYFRAEEQLPACRICGNRVEYGLLMSAPTADADGDLNEKLKKVG
jgi:hypothetical protein